ncbi:TetR/AcrR family transcriptional regulator [Pseudokineococcus sp. 5B2Z-1]|uniref:TetR/AcrR family transcriptional regulator n=1 Tax=Pseudokineococcus sp. 5B2Z-1 TaxID=3132744 RepID=UPI0030AB0B1F
MDPRVARTRQGLQEALLALARERPLDEITVADVAERAGVNRSTYYQHYGDKDTLLADALDAATAAAGEQIGTRSGAEADEPVVWTSPGDLARARGALLAYLTHVEENADLYRRVLGEHGSALAAGRVRRRVEAIVGDALVGGAEEVPGVPLTVTAGAISGLALGVVTAWVERAPDAPAGEVAEWLWRVLDHQGLLGAGPPA